MARSLQDAGLEELAAVKRRANRQHTLGRISGQDRDHVVALLDSLTSFIIEMDETDEKGGGSPW
jgi:hypothetical protein